MSFDKKAMEFAGKAPRRVGVDNSYHDLGMVGVFCFYSHSPVTGEMHLNVCPVRLPWMALTPFAAIFSIRVGLSVALAVDVFRLNPNYWLKNLARTRRYSVLVVK